MSVSNGIVASRPSAAWTRRGPGLWRERPPRRPSPGGRGDPGLNDSKKLTEKKREALYDLITAQAEAYSVARVRRRRSMRWTFSTPGCWP